MRILIASLVAIGTTVLATESAVAQLAEKKALTLEAARKMVAAAEAAAERHHLRGVIAVCDDGGWPILVERMDNSAFTASGELAPEKARSAALFKKPTAALDFVALAGAASAGTFESVQLAPVDYAFIAQTNLGNHFQIDTGKLGETHARSAAVRDYAKLMDSSQCTGREPAESFRRTGSRLQSFSPGNATLGVCQC
jgi:uncharacterized protein GlcG (DUF336 family)